MLVGAYSSGHAVYMKVSSTPYLVFRIPYSVFLAALEALYLPLWSHCLTATLDFYIQKVTLDEKTKKLRDKTRV